MKVSVIIPAHERAPFLERAIDSALKQKEVTEVLVIDDGLHESVVSKIYTMMVQYESIKFHHHKDRVNLGPAASRNLGIINATQKFISFLDSDDYYLDNRFKKTKVAFAQNPSANGVYEAVLRKKEGKELYNELITVPLSIEKENLFEFILTNGKYWISLDGLTLRKNSLSSDDLFDERFRLSEDTDFVLRLSLSKYLVPGSLENPVTIAVTHHSNTTLQIDLVNTYRYMLFKKWHGIMLNSQYSLKVNRHIIRGLLYTYMKTIYKKDNFIVMSILKCFRLIKLVIFHPISIIKYLD